MRRALRTLLAAAAAAVLLVAAPAWGQEGGGGAPAAGEAEAAPGESDSPPELARNSGARYDPRQEPAEGPAYQYRLMGLGLVIMAVTIAFVVWLVRRQSRARR